MSQMKICGCCGKTKSIDNFYYHKRGESKRASFCKDCTKELVKEHHKMCITRNQNIDNPFNLKTKVCRVCGKSKSISEFYKDRTRIDSFRGDCKECASDYSKTSQHKHQKINRGHRLKRVFGITLEEYDRLFESQKGVCAICGKPDMTGRRLAIDHNHQTGEIRGLLCGMCNVTLGRVQESAELLKRMIEYLN